MSRDITLLHPEVQVIIPKFLEECKKIGLIVKITDTLRNKEEQDKLYAQGRTTAGKIVTWVKYPYSNHNWGMAFDICRNDGKGAYNDSDCWFSKVGTIGKKLGLTWGGDWKGTPDKPHFELTKYGSTEQLQKKYTTPENFKKTWKEINIPKQEIKKDIFDIRNYSYNGKIKSFKIINKDGENYIRARDISELLNKSISYNNNSKITFFEDIIKDVKIELSNKLYSIQCINANGNNFAKVRDLADILGYETTFNENTKQIFLKLKKSVFNFLKK